MHKKIKIEKLSYNSIQYNLLIFYSINFIYQDLTVTQIERDNRTFNNQINPLHTDDEIDNLE